MIPFYLRKWYLDLIGQDGTVMYAYFMATRIAGVPGGNVSAHLKLADGKPLQANLNRTVTLFDSRRNAACMPSFLANSATGAHVHLEFPSLNLDLHYRGSCDPWSPEPDGVLLQRNRNYLSWKVPLPSAAVAGTIRSGSQEWRVSGTGYQDLVEMTLAPWRLPVAELVWGRAHCGGCTVVFDRLLLTDGSCLSYLMLRGEGSNLSLDKSVDFTIDADWEDRETLVRHADFTLRLTHKCTLMQGAIASGGQIRSRLLQGLLARLSGNPIEKKMVADAELCTAKRTIAGHAIHERVKWNWPEERVASGPRKLRREQHGRRFRSCT